MRELRRIPRPFRQAAKLALKQDWKITHTGSGHIRWQSPDQHQPIVFTSHTPGGGRSVPNCLAKLKSAGLKGL